MTSWVYISAHVAWTLAVPNLSYWSPRRPWGRPPPGHRAFQSSSQRLCAAGPGSAPPDGRTAPPLSARQSHKEPQPTVILRTMTERKRDMAEVTPYAIAKGHQHPCVAMFTWMDRWLDQSITFWEWMSEHSQCHHGLYLNWFGSLLGLGWGSHAWKKG